MAGVDNLKPVRSKEEARERGKKGGIASGEARKARKTFKEQLLIMLETDNLQDDILNALVKQARRGNIKAYEVLRDTIGEKPIESIEITTTTSEVVQDIEAYIASNDKKD